MRQKKIESIAIDDLCLWTENPRDPLTDKSDNDIIKAAVVDVNGKWKLQSLLNSMGNFFDYSESPIVVEIDNKYIVYDGNRRVVLLKFFQNIEQFDDLKNYLSLKTGQEGLFEEADIPCAVYDIDTALDAVERKHSGSGTWSELDRHYFEHLHRGKDPSYFLRFEMATDLISSNPKLNQRFVSEEVITDSKMKNMGFSISPKGELLSMYDKTPALDIIGNLVSAVDDKVIWTRGNYRGKPKEAIISRREDLKEIITPFNPDIKAKKLNKKAISNTTAAIARPTDRRRTKRAPASNLLFGQALLLKKGRINDLYLAIKTIYDRLQNDPTIIPILGMSLRLLAETAAREYFSQQNNTLSNTDSAFGPFLKAAKESMNLKAEESNYLALTNSFLKKSDSFEATMHKFAHGTIVTEKSDVIRSSIILGDILKHYFSRE